MVTLMQHLTLINAFGSIKHKVIYKISTESANNTEKVTNYANDKGDFGEFRAISHRETGSLRSAKVLIKAKLDENEKTMQLNELQIQQNLVKEN